MCIYDDYKLKALCAFGMYAVECIRIFFYIKNLFLVKNKWNICIVVRNSTFFYCYYSM